MTRWNYGVWVAFALILAFAIATRLVGLAWAPPQISQDEASNTYDAYCLLKTGMDRWQHRWPLILHSFGQGDSRPAMYAYCVIPFLNMLGMENLAVATRLPAAIGGVITVAILFLLLYRICGPWVAMWGGAFLAVSPWHIQLTRMGLECALTPIFWPAALLCLSLAGWHFGDSEHPHDPSKRRHPVWMAAVGFVVALAPYSYASQRVFMPAMLAACCFIFRARLLCEWRSRSIRPGWIVAGVTFLLVLAPLAWSTISDWSDFISRSRHVSIFHQPDSTSRDWFRFAQQYCAHYGATWLFESGDHSVIHSTPGVGVIHWILLPLIVLGIVECVRHYRRKRVYTVVLAWLVLYPIASAPTVNSPHAFRAAVGIGVFEWLAAIGIGTLTRWFSNKAILRFSLVGVTMLALVAATRNSLDRYFRVFANISYIHALYQQDLVQVINYVRPRHENYDRIFISDARSSEHGWVSLQPYIYLLCYLPVEPEDFWSWEIQKYYPQPNLGFENVDQVGKYYFTMREDVWRRQFDQRPNERVLVFARPGDIRGGSIIDVIRDIKGRVCFEVIAIGPMVLP